MLEEQEVLFVLIFYPIKNKINSNSNGNSNNIKISDIMCNLKLQLNNEIIMEDVITIDVINNNIIATDLFGDSKEFNNCNIVKIDMNNSLVVIEENKK